MAPDNLIGFHKLFIDYLIIMSIILTSVSIAFVNFGGK